MQPYGLDPAGAAASWATSSIGPHSPERGRQASDMGGAMSRYRQAGQPESPCRRCTEFGYRAVIEIP